VPEATHPVQVIRFGVFEVDLRAGELRKQGLKIRLQEKPFQILAVLLGHPSEVVTRDELRQRLWAADTFVDFDHGLNTAINRLRESLGDSAENPRFIETLPRHGYRFIFPLSGQTQEDVTRPVTPAKREKSRRTILPAEYPNGGPPAEAVVSGGGEALAALRHGPSRGQKGVAVRVNARRRPGWFVPWGLSVAVLLLAVFLAFAYFRTSPVPAPAVSSSILPPEGASHVFEPEAGGPVLSPDGSLLLFPARDVSGEERLWLRSLDSLTARPLEETENASFPFWSPDSRSVGFFVPGKLKKVAIFGGPPQVICDALNGRGGTWNSKGMIIFSANELGGLALVPARGGTPTPLELSIKTHRNYSQRWPAFLPDGIHFLYWEGTPRDLEPVASPSGIYVGSIYGKEQEFLLQADSDALYVPPGFLLFMRNGILLAQRFDASHLKLVGEASPVAGPVANPEHFRLGHFSVSRTGFLVYQSAKDRQTDVHWLDAQGRETGIVDGPSNIDWVRLSPDGKTLAETVRDPQSNNLDIWLVHLSSGVRTRFTFTPSINMHAIFSPDGGRIVFASTRNGSHNLYIKRSNGTGEAKPLLLSGKPFLPIDWSRDGKFIAYDQRGPNGMFDIWILPLSGDRKPFPFIHDRADDPYGVFSPDGHWFAYESNETGRFEVYVVPFPGPGGKWQISSGGGIEPAWRSDGKGLYYLAPGSKLMEADITTRGSVVEMGSSHELFHMDSLRSYQVADNGTRFLVLESEENASPTLTLVTNWGAHLKK
jgi:eukaryotic-like serine/threonine-protein kinase